MSENTFPFPGDEAPSYEEAAADGNRSRILVFGALAAAVVLGGGYLLLGGGDSSELTAANDVVRPSRVVKAAEAAKTPVLATLPVKYDEQIGRDPFRALYVQPAPAAVAAPAVPVPSGVLVPVFGGTGSGGAAGPAAPGGAPTTQTYKLVLTRVYGTAADRTAVFAIDGKQQVAKIGTKFGPTSEIILLSFQEGPKPGQWTTVLQVGDGDPFDVVTGVPAYVR